MHSRVVVAGTFDTLHAGHRALIDRAFEVGKSVLIGLCTDAFARERKGPGVRPYTERKRALLKFLGRRAARAEIFPLSDPVGIAATDRKLDAIVVSTESKGMALAINKLRRRAGLRSLRIITMPLIYGEDLKKLSSERIKRGKVSRDGRLLRPVLIAVGSENRTKVDGVRAMAGKFFKSSRVIGVKVDSEISKQPFERETLEGAVNRAIAAYRKTGADYGVGMESGLFRHYGRHFDVQWCAVYDGENVTLGHSMGFEIPPAVVELIRKRRWDMNRVFEELTGIRGIGKRKGAIGYMSRGMTERKFMSEQSFLCAMIPRLNVVPYGNTYK